MEFDTGKCWSMHRVKGRLSVTDKSIVHEDQIIEIQCSKHPRRAGPCCHNWRLSSGPLE